MANNFVCRLCQTPIRLEVSIQRGYGPSCWRKLQHYQAAQKGVAHGGHLEKARTISDQQLQKGMRPYQRQINLHKDKIAHPEAHIERWSKMSSIDQQRLIHKWQKDIQRLQIQRDIWLVELKNREAKSDDKGAIDHQGMD